MSKHIIFDFLEALAVNNSKEWMDANRQWYFESKEVLIEIFDPVLESLKAIDPRIIQPTARKAISRINNNLMFHPDRPTYKNHFGIVFGFGKGKADFYVQLGVERNLLAGGLWHPTSDQIKKIRSEIDYEGHQLESILNARAFKKRFEMFTEDSLKTTPKGYPKDHQHIELLRLKSIAGFQMQDRKEVLSPAYAEDIVDAYQTIIPMIDFLNVAIGED